VSPPVDGEEPAEYTGLHNVVTYSPGLLAGSAPEGDAGFQTLAAMGVKTIISVDGAAPEADRARARGIRYIHLPIGYNGMDHARALEIAKAIQDGEASGPVYVHCHHGKHRAACAAGVGAVSLGLISPDAALARMKISGTAPNYTGLFEVVSAARPASREELDSVADDFPEVWRTSGLVRSMVEIDEAFDHLGAIEAAGWTVPQEHPDQVPAAEAGRLADLFRNLGEDERVRAKPPEFREHLAEAAERAASLESRLIEPTVPGPPTADLGARLKLIAASCKVCHAKYRD
jgi:protein tyrosine phosphatase (PTP) superfamily phosphohydrolase (DUF442 family)